MPTFASRIIPDIKAVVVFEKPSSPLGDRRFGDFVAKTVKNYHGHPFSVVIAVYFTCICVSPIYRKNTYFYFKTTITIEFFSSAA